MGPTRALAERVCVTFVQPALLFVAVQGVT